MVDKTLDQTGEDSTEVAALLKEQLEMEREWQASQPVSPLPFDCTVTRFVVPSARDYTPKVVSLAKNPSNELRLIFAALYTAHYLYFYTDSFSKDRATRFSSYIGILLDFLNSYSFNNSNRVNVLKDYEADRIKKGSLKKNNKKLKTQSSGLSAMKTMIINALDYPEFYKQLNDIEYSYLLSISKTKVAPKDLVGQATLTEWFAQHTWLRRGDVGIGHQLYSLLKSPKALISSFETTTVTSLLEIQQAKFAMIKFFREADWRIDDIPEQKFDLNSSKGKSKDMTTQVIALFNAMRGRYCIYPNDQHLDAAISMMITEMIHEPLAPYLRRKFMANEVIFKSIRYGKTKRLYARESARKGIFSYSYVRELFVYATSKGGESKSVPTCYVEDVLFSWIMAIRTVQPSDIPKLTQKNFRTIERRSGKVTHIHLNYFKGRSGQNHEVKSFSTRTDIGKAVLRFLLDKKNFGPESNPIRIAETYKSLVGINSLAPLIECLMSHLGEKVRQRLREKNVSTVFIDAIEAIVNNGVVYAKRIHHNKVNYLNTVDTPVYGSGVFGLSYIKNSAVHSRSDAFTPTQLFNFHSHSNHVERESYLSRENQEWIDNCGLITRAVMQDLAVNMFRASEKAQAVFNSEFTRASEYINNQRQHILGRLRLLTEEKHGHIDELGFVEYVDHLDIPGTIYLVDCPETVLKHRHYVNEVKRKYKLLLENSPKFLVFEVLPTVEWIEVLFDEKRFSKRSVAEADVLYKKYGSELPPLFMEKIGG